MPDFPIPSTYADLYPYVLADCRKVQSDLRQMGVLKEIDVEGLASVICQRMVGRNCQCCRERWPDGATGSAENYRRAWRNCLLRHRRATWTRRTVCRAVRGNNSPGMPVQPGQLEGSMIWPPLRKYNRVQIDQIVVRECADCTAWRRTELPGRKKALKARKEAGETLTEEELAIQRLRKSRVRSWDLRVCFAGHASACEARRRIHPSNAPLSTLKWIFAADPDLVEAASETKMCRLAWTEPALEKLIDLARLGDRWVPLPTWLCPACGAPYRARHCLGPRLGGCTQPEHDRCPNPKCHEPHTVGKPGAWPRARRWWWVESLDWDCAPAAPPAPAPAGADATALRRRWVAELVSHLTTAQKRKLHPPVAAWQIEAVRLLLEEQIAAGAAVLSLLAPPADPAAFFARFITPQGAAGAAERLRPEWDEPARRYHEWLRLMLGGQNLEDFLQRIEDAAFKNPPWLRLAVRWVCDRQLQDHALAGSPERFAPAFPGEPGQCAALPAFLREHGYDVSETTVTKAFRYFAEALQTEWSDLTDERSDAPMTPKSDSSRPFSP